MSLFTICPTAVRVGDVTNMLLETLDAKLPSAVSLDLIPSTGLVLGLAGASDSQNLRLDSPALVKKLESSSPQEA